MSRESDQHDIDRFWSDMERESGESILKKGLIRVIYSRPLDLKDKWLLFFSSETGLYYKRFPSGSIMGRLLDTAAKTEDYPVVYLPWEKIGCSLYPRDFFTRIFAGPDKLELKWGEDQLFLLEVDSRSLPVFEGRLHSK